MSLLQTVNIIIAGLALAVLIVWMKQNREHRLLALPVLIWLVHVVTFYFIISVDTLLNLSFTAALYTVWSSYLRMHALLTILSCFGYMVDWSKVLKR